LPRELALAGALPNGTAPQHKPSTTVTSVVGAGTHSTNNWPSQRSRTERARPSALPVVLRCLVVVTFQRESTSCPKRPESASLGRGRRVRSREAHELLRDLGVRRGTATPPLLAAEPRSAAPAPRLITNQGSNRAHLFPVPCDLW